MWGERGSRPAWRSEGALRLNERGRHKSREGRGSACLHGLLFPLPASPASQLGLQFGSHFLPPGQRGPCRSENSWAALGARKAEGTRPYRSGDHKAAIEEAPCLKFWAGLAPEWPNHRRVLCGFLSSLFLGCAMTKQLANQTTDTPWTRMREKA